MSNAKNWCFTLNNYLDAEVNHIVCLQRDHGDVNYLCYGFEEGAEGTPHMQGYIQFANRKRLAAVRRIVSDRAHFEVAKGTPAQNILYCSKEGKFFEYGEVSKAVAAPGRYQEAIEFVKNGGNINGLWNEYPDQMIRYRCGFLAYFRHINVIEQTTHCLTSFRWTFDKDFKKSIIFWGSPGIGKTCFAAALLPNALFVTHMDQLLEYDADKHDGIIFDDMDFAHHPRTAQIHLADNEQPRAIHCRFQIARIPRNTKKIFTTNNESGRIFTDDAAINRRIRIIHLI